MRSSRRIRFTPEADDDIRSLLADSFERWGETRQFAYARRLSNATEDLLAHPQLGHARDDLLPGLRGLRAGSHMIYYLVDERMVTIVRVLHTRMDPARHLLPRE